MYIAWTHKQSIEIKYAIPPNKGFVLMKNNVGIIWIEIQVS